MFFVFHFLVFAYITHSEINCFTQGSIRTTNYVREHEEISNLRGAAQHKRTNQKINKFNNDLKSNIFDKLLTDEMLSVEQRHNQEDSSKNPFLIPSKFHSAAATLEIKTKWPILKSINTVREAEINNQNEDIDIETKYNDEYLDPLSKSKIVSKLKIKANNLAEQEVPNHNKVPCLKTEINKPSKSPLNNKIIGMRSIPNFGSKGKCKCKKTDPSSPCTCSGTSHNKKRCTHATPNAKAHECSRFGSAVTNHSCSQPQPFQKFVSPNPYSPYSFYPVYVPYTYFVSEAPMMPYKISYPEPDLLSDLKIPRHHKHKCRKLTTRVDDDLYYEDSRGRKPYDDNDYYHESKKQSTKGIVYDVNQDVLIKEIVKDLKIHNNNEFVKECYCDSSVSLCTSNIFVLVLTLLSFAF